MFAFLKNTWKRWNSVLFVLLLLALVTFLPSSLFRTALLTDPVNLPALSLNGVHRLLVLAPHCDDETLGTGGLILAAQRAGIQVRVVIATNGDGYFFATAQDFGKLYPHPQDYIRMGELRQKESLAALAVLGVKPEQVIFLSYPDRGSPAMWNDHWSAGSPYRSPYSGDTQSPYALTYHPSSVYAGEDYLRDLRSILADYRPDLIVYPNPEDIHPDHWGLNAFTRLAITLENHADPAFQPAQYTYLVHRPEYPAIKGLKPQASLTLPPAMFQAFPNWVRLDLTPADVALKGVAVNKYRSQLPLLRKLMDSFIRRNELFAPVADAALLTVSKGQPLDPSTWRDAAGQPLAAVQIDPVNDIFTHRTIPATDLVAVYAARDGQGNLLACSGIKEETAPEVAYVIRIKALTDTGILAFNAEAGGAQPGWHTASRLGPYACISVPLTELGNPWAIYVSAATEGLDRLTLDQTGWQMVRINSSK